MGWDIGKAFHKVANAAGNLVHGAAVVGAKGLEDVVEAPAIMDTFTPMADRIDNALQAFTAPKSPEVVAPGRLADNVTLVPGVPSRIVPPGGFHLTAGKPDASFGVQMAGPGDARLDLTAAGPGTDWGKKGAESAVMSVYVDGKYQQDVVLWGGANKQAYSLALGHLSAGEHTITVRYAKEKSRPGAQGVDISAGSATAVTYATKEDQWAAENAPYLIGRHGGLQNTYTDTPLALMHRIEKQPDGTTKIVYTVVFSNEDSGDGGQPTLEQARWGRLTDLETLYSVTLDKNGKPIERTLEGNGHVWRGFKGEMDGTHPILRTQSDNNNVTDQGGGVLRFQMTTDNPASNDAPNEDVMRRHPEFFRVEAKELLREGKISPHGACTRPDTSLWGEVHSILGDSGLVHKDTMADPRDYVYLQFKADGAESDPIIAKVILKDGRTCLADDGTKGVAINRDGWSQTAVKLPPGVTANDIARVEYASAGTGHVVALGHAYTLSNDFQPVELGPNVWNRPTA